MLLTRTNFMFSDLTWKKFLLKEMVEGKRKGHIRRKINNFCVNKIDQTNKIK